MFIKLPSVLHGISTIGGPEFEDVMIGWDGSNDLNANGDADMGYISYYSSYWEKYILWQYSIVGDDPLYPFDCIFTCAGETYHGNTIPINDQPAFVSDTHCVYYVDGRWIMRAILELGWSRPPDASAVFEFWTYVGDEPWGATFTKRGLAAADVTTTIATWARWERDYADGQLGIYSPAGAATGDKYIGVPMYKDMVTGKTYIRSLQRHGDEANPKYDYEGTGECHWNQTAYAWIIGTFESAAGWNQGDTEPNVDAPVTLVWTTMGGEDPPVGEDITLTYYNHVMGEGYSQDNYVSEAAIWRV